MKWSNRDAKSPISGGRLPYLDVHYGLTYGHHTHAGEAAVLLLDCQTHHCLLIYTVLMQTRDARDVARLYTWRIGVIKVKKNKEIYAKVQR